MGRGLYGQREGNEFRVNADVLADRYADNDLLEGNHVENLREYAKNLQWTEFQKYCDSLRADGFSRSRVESIINRALSGVRL